MSDPRQPGLRRPGSRQAGPAGLVLGLTSLLVVVGCDGRAAPAAGQQPAGARVKSSAAADGVSSGSPRAAAKESSRPTTPAPSSTVEHLGGDSARAAALPDGGRLFVDLSGSMKGYAGASPASVESVHRAVLDALSASNVLSVDLCEVRDSPEPRCGLAPDPTRYRSPSGYNATQSLLAPVVAPPEKAERRPDAAPVSDPLAERRVSVLLTDAHVYMAAERTEWPCTAGTDALCLQRALELRADEGYGLWLVAAALPFEGRIYPERGLDPVLFERVLAHVEGLRQDPAWQGISLALQKPRRNRRTRTDSYGYSGPRAFLIFVLSRDLTMGRAVTRRIHAELQRSRVSPLDSSIRWVELSPYTPARHGFTELSRVTVDERSEGVLPLGRPRRRAEELWGEFECRDQAVAGLRLKVEELHPAQPPLPPSLRQETAVVLDDQARWSKAVLPPGPEPGDAGAYRSGIRCLGFARGITELRFRLQSKVTAPPGAPPGWWHAWSSDNSFEQPERLFRLAELVDSLISRAAHRPVEQHDSLRIRVHKN